jgi:general stress protein YciG
MANEKKEDAGRQGFASMDPDKQRDIASEGGQSVPDEKRSFSRDRELAAEAGREGGLHSHGGNKPGGSQDAQQSGSSADHRGGGGNFADDRERASEAGKKGGSH